MSVLDASALLAYLFEEPGADQVAAIMDTAWLSSVNLSEVLARLARDGIAPVEFAAELDKTNLQIAPFLAEDAVLAASLETETRPFGLSLGDRACLALGLVRSQPVYTADQVWGRLAVGAEVVVIR